MSASIEVHIKDHSKEIDSVINDKIRLALSLMGEVVEGYAKQDCPVDTGNLRGSITHEAGEHSGDPCEYVGSNVEYAPYVEFIDRYHHPVGKAHFLRDGAMQHISELKNKAEVALSTI